MKPKEPVDLGEQDLFRSRLDQILDMGHAKVVLANSIDWEFLAKHCGENYADVPECRGGHPALPTRLMAGLHILKYADDLSDEEVCAKFVENPYYQFFCGELFFRHDLPLDRSSMTSLSAALRLPAGQWMAPAYGGGEDHRAVAGKPLCCGEAGGCKALRLYQSDR